MMWTYVARQPILAANKEMFGYELLFRNGENNAFPDVSGEEATSRLIVEQQLDADIHDTTGDHLAFINFSRMSLLEEHPKLLPPHKVVIEVLEDVEPDEQIIAVCQDLKSSGYSLALDDHDFNKGWHSWLHLFDIVKIDISQFTKEELVSNLAQSDFHSVRLLAERVETLEDFTYCQQLGFSLFQGYFFAKPQMIRRQALSASKLSTIQLLALLCKEEVDFAELETVISLDPGLSFKLLRFINSAHFGLGSRISNVNQALIYLGVKEVTRFVSLISLASLSGNEHNAAITLAATRAYFCSILAEKVEGCQIRSSAFLIGLFSMMDTLIEDSMENILRLLPVDDTIRDALLRREGQGGLFLQLAECFESADWVRVAEFGTCLGIDEETLGDCYREAVGTVSKFTGS